ncbi:MAG: FtsX-like permease family protein [Bacteroidaceae bacterium]|nr:FtsX-like permease family protein [Bacteroidaceae bacterium]
MIGHNLSLAWRQLVKYRLQSAVSIVSLAIGFACFALASMWIKYETTYDAFHKDANEIHVILKNGDIMLSTDTDPRTLRELPQLEQFSHVNYVNADTINGMSLYGRGFMMNDTNFVALFGLDIVEGNGNFVHNENEVAISDQFAHKIFGDESPIGKEMTIMNTLTIISGDKVREEKYILSLRVSAVFRDWGEHTNFRGIDFLLRKPINPNGNLNPLGSCLMARISPMVDMEALNARLDTMRIYRNIPGLEGVSAITLDELFTNQRMKAVPITKVRHETNLHKKMAAIKINHVYLFAISGGMLILCGLLNYLTMFINRLFIRKREIALRSVFGATGGKLMVQFLTEYGLLLLIALFCGIYVVQVSLDWFLEMSGLPEDWDFFHRESLVYMLMVFMVSILISIPVIWYFRRQSLQSSITGVGGLMKYNLFRRISTGVQIGISFLCIFCTVVLLKQLNTLRHGDIGFERENRIVYQHINWEEIEEMASFLKQCPEVDTAFISPIPIYPTTREGTMTLHPHHFPELTNPLKLSVQWISKAIVDFYGLTLSQGRWLHDGENQAIMVNESFVRQMGWKNPLEHSIHENKIVGVVKDFQNISPTIKAECCVIRSLENTDDIRNYAIKNLLLRYKPGCKQALMEKIEDFFNKRGSTFYPDNWEDLTDEYNKMLQSEENLQTLISVTTGVCILIALFGVWSMIMLTCEQRRKEIAIRKVYGATTKDILDMFFIEYMSLQGIAAIVAFPIGYACMKPWLEQYVVQTEISWWIYVGIFLMVALLVALCVGWRVWKTAKARPADEIE